MANHGVQVFERATAIATPVVASSGIPFVVGCAPIHSADHPATVGVPTLCTSWDEVVDLLGYSDDWTNFDLSEFAYSHFVLYNMQPAIFLNVFDPTTMKATQAAANFTVTEHKVDMGALAIKNSNLEIKAGSPLVALVEDTDYEVYFTNGHMVIELLSGGSAYSASTLNIAYDKAVFTSITTATIATAFGNIDLCATSLGVIPDTLVAPNWSCQSAVAAVMASKAAAITGLFRGKALIDIPSDSVNGATTYSAVVAKKNNLAMTDPNEIVCWPMLKLGDDVYHFSTQLAGLLASVDTENRAPYCSPSNHGIKCDSMVLADGTTEVLLTKAQADILNNGGVVTALNFMGGWVDWGNYCACYPTNTDVKDYFIPISRMFDWVANTLIQTFWGQLDKPMTRRLIDTILDSANIWLNGLTGSGYILGGRVEMLESENTVQNLMAGIINLHVYLTPPSPAQEIDFTLEYDASYVQAALQA